MFSPDFLIGASWLAVPDNARRKAGVPAFLIHDLRRTAARNMLRSGVGEKMVMSIVGWKTRAMLDRYNILDERDVVEAGKKMRRQEEENGWV
jgi:integrase